MRLVLDVLLIALIVVLVAPGLFLWGLLCVDLWHDFGPHRSR